MHTYLHDSRAEHAPASIFALTRKRAILIKLGPLLQICLFWFVAAGEKKTLSQIRAKKTLEEEEEDIEGREIREMKQLGGKKGV